MADPLAVQIDALRRGAGAFTVFREAIAVRGPDAEAYLQGQLSQDIVPLAVGAATDSLLLQPDGKLSALVRVTRVDAQGFVLDIDAGYADTVVARLKKFLLRSKVEMERLEWRCVALRGSGVDEAAAGLLEVLAEGGVMALPFEWNGWTGIDLLGPPEVVLLPSEGSGITRCDADAVEACRIVSGIPAMGSELTDKTIAAEAGLVERTVSFTKGCYTGQELIARLQARGNNVPRRLVGVIDGTDRDGPPLTAGMTLHVAAPPATSDVAADKVVGTVTSAAWSPEIGEAGAWVGLAYLHRSVPAPGAVRLRSGDRLGEARPAEVTLLPQVGPRAV